MGRHNQAGPRIYGRSDVPKQPLKIAHNFSRDFEKNVNGRDIDCELRECCLVCLAIYFYKNDSFIHVEEKVFIVFKTLLLLFYQRH